MIYVTGSIGETVMGLVSRKEGKNSPKSTAPVGVGMGFTLNNHDMYEVGLFQGPKP
jgi:hypothetical protein